MKDIKILLKTKTTKSINILMNDKENSWKMNNKGQLSIEKISLKYKK